jgi:pyridoxine 5-phosphate synthase
MDLLVNIDHVATLRNARGEGYPDPAEAARVCEAAGAAGIVFHLRGDRRHIRDEDLPKLKEAVKGRLDFEMAATEEMLGICAALKPDLCTLVPEGREELTTEGGLRLAVDSGLAADFRVRVVPVLKRAGVEISLFLDPVEEDIRLAAELGVEAIELHTGPYANADRLGQPEQARIELDRLAKAAALAHSLGLAVNAGHGLNLRNLPAFLATVPHLHDISSGHALISDALYLGLEEAVEQYQELIASYRKG